MFACVSGTHGVENTVIAGKKGAKQEETKKLTVIFLDFDKSPAKVKLRLMTVPLPTLPCT